MTRRSWVWVVVGLLAWTAVVVLWAAGPTVCSVPAAHPSDHCEDR